MKKPEVHFRSRGRTGNIYVILALVQEELRKERRIAEFNEIWERVHNSKSHEEALAVIRETINLIDDDGKV